MSYISQVLSEAFLSQKVVISSLQVVNCVLKLSNITLTAFDSIQTIPLKYDSCPEVVRLTVQSDNSRKVKIYSKEV